MLGMNRSEVLLKLWIFPCVILKKISSENTLKIRIILEAFIVMEVCACAGQKEQPAWGLGYLWPWEDCLKVKGELDPWPLLVPSNSNSVILMIFVNCLKVFSPASCRQGCWEHATSIVAFAPGFYAASNNWGKSKEYHQNQKPQFSLSRQLISNWSFSDYVLRWFNHFI